MKYNLLKEKQTFLTALALYSLYHLSLNYPAWSMKVLDKSSYRLIEKAAVALCS